MLYNCMSTIEHPQMVEWTCVAQFLFHKLISSSYASTKSSCLFVCLFRGVGWRWIRLFTSKSLIYCLKFTSVVLNLRLLTVLIKKIKRWLRTVKFVFDVLKKGFKMHTCTLKYTYTVFIVVSSYFSLGLLFLVFVSLLHCETCSF